MFYFGDTVNGLNIVWATSSGLWIATVGVCRDRGQRVLKKCRKIFKTS